jgi:hypothetical protein
MLRSDHSAFLTVSPFSRWAKLCLFLCGALLALGCTPKIGDSCTVSTNCSTSGDRLCDITQPGGYCTIFNCEPDTCPVDSLCINFGTSLSSMPGCTPSQGNSPYQRSFCMASCGSDGDCRGGYSCLSAKEVGGVLAENSRSGKVCAVKPKAMSEEVAIYDGGADGGISMSNEVCTGSDAGPEAGGAAASSGGAGGTSAAGGAAGESGAAGDGGSAG